MHVLLTGPFGTIGTRVLDELLTRGHRVRCFDLDTPNNRQWHRRYRDRVDMQWGDITNSDDVAQAVVGVDGIIHLAAMIPPMSEQRPELAERVNVYGTQLLLEAAGRQTQTPVFIFPSSISVHGYSAGRQPPCRVDTPMEARDNYAGHKIACEKLIQASDLRFVILRVGACDDAENQKDLDKKAMLKLMLSLSPDTRIEYLHPKDAAIAMVNALSCKAAWGKALFLGSGAASQQTWLEYVNLSLNASGIGSLKASNFGTEPYYTDWMDTDESQRLLQFQRYGLEAYRQELMHKHRYSRPLVKLLSPLLRVLIVRAGKS